MLFDLRGRGRRRTIQIIYLFLALLIGGGLIFFGIGGGSGSGGLLNAVNNNGTSASSVFTKRLKADERRAAASPSDPTAWATVANDHYELAISTLNSTSQSFAGSSLRDLRASQAAWQRYLALNPPHPDASLAIKMTTVLSGLNDLAGAAAAAEIYANAYPTAATYARMAQYAYAAHNTGLGDLASRKALSLAPAAQKTAYKTLLDQVKKNPTGTSGSGSTTGTTTGAKTGTLTG
jgi:hypothetical protein